MAAPAAIALTEVLIYSLAADVADYQGRRQSLLYGFEILAPRRDGHCKIPDSKELFENDGGRLTDVLLASPSSHSPQILAPSNIPSAKICGINTYRLCVSASRAGMPGRNGFASRLAGAGPIIWRAISR